MAMNLQRLKYVSAADVYKQGRLAGRLARVDAGAIAFTYDPTYLSSGMPRVATTLPLTDEVIITPAGGLPAFFSGLLTEGHRLTVLRNAAKTSLDDELTLLMAVGADVPGDVQIVPSGEVPSVPRPHMLWP